jgi:putative transposase
MVAPYTKTGMVSAGTSAPTTLIPVTNSIEALNSKLRRAVRARGHFPSDEAATKLLYLILNRSEKEWRMPPREWTMAKAQFAVIFGERFIKAMAA